MVIGYVLVTIAPSYEHEIYNKLSKIKEITELHPLFGEYDFVAKIEGESYEKLGNLIITKIRSIEGVMDTKTLTGAKI